MYKHQDLLQHKAEQVCLCTHLQCSPELLKLHWKNLQNHQQQIGYPEKKYVVSEQDPKVVVYFNQI